MSRIMVISGGGPDLDVRLGSLLEYLRRTGHIDGYTVFDWQGRPDGPDFFPEYDAVVVHRLLPLRLHHVFQSRRIRFLLDIDGAPIQALAAYGAGSSEPVLSAAPMREAVFLAGGVLAASARQAEILAEYCSLPPSAVHLLPPAFPGERSDRQDPPQAIVFASCRGVVLTESRQAVLSAIGDFAARHRVPILNASEETGLFTGERPLSGAAGWAFEARLRSCGPVIAAVPMETDGGPFLADYVDFQSDLEKALFGSLGIGGVYSDAPPFTAPGLPTGITVANDYGSWIAGLSEAWERAADPTFANRDAVLRQRGLGFVAVHHLLPPLKAVFREGQISPKDLVVPSC